MSRGRLVPDGTSLRCLSIASNTDGWGYMCKGDGGGGGRGGEGDGRILIKSIFIILQPDLFAARGAVAKGRRQAR